MKYLKLFEAFQSSALSKTIGFLNSKIGKSSSDKFTEILKRLMDIYDIPIDKIKDEDIQYLTSSKALNLKKDSVNNVKEISYIKFWFSLETGFLGYTGTPVSPVPFVTSGSSRKNEIFTKDEIEYIQDNLRITTGTLSPVIDYENLKLLDKVVGYFSSSKDLDKLSLATIWREDSDLWAIQDVADGGSPNRRTIQVGDVEYIWRDFGSTHWSLGQVYSPGEDHRKLHHYFPSSEPLKLENKQSSADEDKFSWNVPIDESDGTVLNWGYRTSIKSYEDLQKSDFCLVLDLDDILKNIDKTRSEIKTEREELKKGSTALINPSELKDININRYIETILKSMNISVETSEVKNLQKLMNKLMRDKYSLISIYRDVPSSSYISRFTSKIKQLFTEEDKEYIINNIIRDYKNLVKGKASDLVNFSNSEKELTSYPDTKETFDKIFQIGNQVNNYFSKTEINTYQEMKLSMQIYITIKNIMSDEDLKLSRYITRILEEFSDTDSTRYYLERYDYDSNEKLEDLKKLELLEKFLKKLLV